MVVAVDNESGRQICGETRMTFTDRLSETIHGIKCEYGIHEWQDPLCDVHGFYQLLFTRECKWCYKIEASKKSFKRLQ
jgi:hypothetical protein